MTEEEKQKLMAMLMREEAQGQQPTDLGGHMIPLEPPQGGSPGGYSQYQDQQQPAQGSASPMNMKAAQSVMSGASGNASGAMMSDASMPAAVSYPTAPGSMAAATPAAEMAAGTGMGANVAPASVAGGGGGGGGMMAAAGPWAALAAAIIINESNAKGTDRRADNTGEYVGDLLTGAVGAQDGKYMGEKVGGPIGSVMKEASRFTEKTMKGLMPWEWF